MRACEKIIIFICNFETVYKLNMDLSKFKFQIKPHQVSLLLATPRTCALIFTGAAVYIGFVDPYVRESLIQTRMKLKHWSTMYSISLKVMASLALVTCLTGVLAYYKTKQSSWLVGSGVLFLVNPWTYFSMLKINNQLLQADKNIPFDKEITISQKFTLITKMQTWVKRHRVRIGISLAAACLFYYAIDVGINVVN